MITETLKKKTISGFLLNKMTVSDITELLLEQQILYFNYHNTCVLLFAG